MVKKCKGRGNIMAKIIGIDEEETVIVMSRTSGEATVYSSDTKVRNRLKKLYSDKLTKEFKQDGEAVAEEYSIDKRFITFRKALPKRRELSEEEKAELRERLERMRKQKAV